MSKFPQLVQLSECVPELNCNPLKAVDLHNFLASQSCWLTASFALHSHLLCSTGVTGLLPSEVTAEEAVSTTLTRADCLLKCTAQPSSSLLTGGTITISTSNLQPEPPPPPLLLPTYNSERVTGCRQHYFLLPEETRTGKKAKYR